MPAHLSAHTSTEQGLWLSGAFGWTQIMCPMPSTTAEAPNCQPDYARRTHGLWLDDDWPQAVHRNVHRGPQHLCGQVAYVVRLQPRRQVHVPAVHALRSRRTWSLSASRLRTERPDRWHLRHVLAACFTTQPPCSADGQLAAGAHSSASSAAVVRSWRPAKETGRTHNELHQHWQGVRWDAVQHGASTSRWAQRRRTHAALKLPLLTQRKSALPRKQHPSAG